MVSRRSCRIALVETDAATAASVLSTLREAGHVCRRFPAHSAALGEIDGDRFDLLLVGRGLAGVTASQLMVGIRAQLGYALPVIGITPGGDPEELAAALDGGVDDCLASPVPPPLLLAQINAALRRTAPRGPRVEASVGHLEFQPEGMKVYVEGKALVLTAKEYALGLLLCRNLGRPLTRHEILTAVWGDDVPPLTRTLDVHVSRLRTKLELRPQRGFRLSALYGRGYQLDLVAPVAPKDKTRAKSRFIPARSALPSGRPAATHQPLAR